ncbi:hypothetical protein N7470_010086, partial [Penicillium chermesinum]
MAYSKRKTILPHSLWDHSDSSIHSFTTSEKDDRPVASPKSDLNKEPKGSDVVESSNKSNVLPVSNDNIPCNNKSTRFGIPIKPSPQKTAPRSPSVKRPYHRFYKIDQAGPGVVAIMDTETFPVYLIKERHGGPKDIALLRKASHKNLINLVDSFESQGIIHIVYDYQHLAISLACVAGSVDFSEPDMATICKEILRGLLYLHTALKISHGSINCGNVILTHLGEIKIANIGDSLLDTHSSGGFQRDLKAVGSILLYLGDRTNLLCETDSDGELGGKSIE